MKVRARSRGSGFPPEHRSRAEKFQALCALGMANSRMKDYFDLWILLRDGDLDDAELTRAIQATFLPSRTTGQPVKVQGSITVRPAAINALESRDATANSREAAIAAI